MQQAGFYRNGEDREHPNSTSDSWDIVDRMIVGSHDLIKFRFFSSWNAPNLNQDAAKLRFEDATLARMISDPSIPWAGHLVLRASIFVLVVTCSKKHSLLMG